MRREDVERLSRAAWVAEEAGQYDDELAAYPFAVGGSRVLDLGAGPGHFVAALLKAGAQGVVWQDVDEAFLPFAKEHIGADAPVEYRVQDMMDLPYPDASFDVVVVRGALHWAADENRVLRETGRVLKPDGWLVIAGYNYRRAVRTRPRWRGLAHLVPPFAAVVGRRKLITTLWHIRGVLRRRLARWGFEIVEWREGRGDYGFTAFARRPGSSA